MWSSIKWVNQFMERALLLAVDQSSMAIRRTSPLFPTHILTSMMANVKLAVGTLKTTIIFTKLIFCVLILNYIKNIFVHTNEHFNVIFCILDRSGIVSWKISWIWPWRRTMLEENRLISWTNWLTWDWLDSGLMHVSTCGRVTILISMVPSHSFIKRYFHTFSIPFANG